MPPGPSTNGLAIGSLVLGAVSLVVAVVPLLNLAIVLSAPVGAGLGIGGLVAARRHGEGTTMSICGILLAMFAVAVAVVVLLLAGALFASTVGLLLDSGNS